ncbi:Ferredoxin [Acidisarcina polymorpha]|uniref:Ferredoxin n=2 Tax=Acidisarcina polymorpha TaxID=2211140 RepID=A0A2Z5G7R8_9BACT|nr:Ferredoxin [Acidisarcina polymorpha]
MGSDQQFAHFRHHGFAAAVIRKASIAGNRPPRSRSGPHAQNALVPGDMFSSVREESPLPEFDRHIFVCTNRREPGAARPSCSPDGRGELHSLLKDKLKAAKLPGVLRVNKSGCLEQCEHGPTIVVYPEQVWYGFVQPEDLDEIVEEHLRHGRPVERLRLASECLNTPSCRHRPAMVSPASGAPSDGPSGR